MKLDDILFLEGVGFDSNVFLMDDTLIDTGTGMHIQKVWDAVKPEKIKRIINTHCHIDHIGGNRYFKADVYAHELDAEAIAVADPEKTLSMTFPVKIEPREVKPLKAGEKISIGRYIFEVLHTPGHTEGSICLYDPEEKVLVSGDTVFAEGGIGRTDFPTGNSKELTKSLDRLSKLDVEVLLPGHGPVVWDGAARHIKLSYENSRHFLI